MPADDLVANFESGSPIYEIAYNFGLNPNDVRASLAFARSQEVVISNALKILSWITKRR